MELEDSLLFDTSHYPELHESNLCLKNQYNIIFPAVSVPLKLSLLRTSPRKRTYSLLPSRVKHNSRHSLHI